ncbi:MAG: redox-sensitive bicupin YhaK (pirin superfamily) [Bacteroidia bacterium]|jgi:redox-sensitive bicupin YhaK (pirin superfamily)
MTTYKKLSFKTPSQKVNMGGIILDQPLPIDHIQNFDPFLLIHHWNSPVLPGSHQHDLGVGPHPHRGFSPVTFIFQGELHHQDSRGHSSVVKAGGTQWMKAGMGITHSERPSKKLAAEGGEFEIIQFWINDAAKDKMSQPSYQAITPESTPSIESKDGLSELLVVSGEQGNVVGVANSGWPINAFRINMQKGGEMMLDIPEGHNAILYVLNGNLLVNQEESLFVKEVAYFDAGHGDQLKLEARDETRAILLSGTPIGEKVVQYGPFVMNSESEIMEALRDANMGKLGVLIEES